MAFGDTYLQVGPYVWRVDSGASFADSTAYNYVDDNANFGRALAIDDDGHWWTIIGSNVVRLYSEDDTLPDDAAVGDEVSGTSIAISGTTIDLPTTTAYALVALAVDGDGNFYINAYDSDFTSTVQKWDGSTWTKFRNLPANSSFVRGMSVRHSDGLLAISHSNAIYTTDSTSATGTWTEVSDSTTDPVYFEIVNSLTFDNTGGLVVFGVGRRGDSIERRAKRFNLDDDTSADSQTIPGALVTPTFESAGLNDLHATAQDQRNLTVRQGDAAWTTGAPAFAATGRKVKHASVSWTNRTPRFRRIRALRRPPFTTHMAETAWTSGAPAFAVTGNDRDVVRHAAEASWRSKRNRFRNVRTSLVKRASASFDTVAATLAVDAIRRDIITHSTGFSTTTPQPGVAVDALRRLKHVLHAVLDIDTFADPTFFVRGNAYQFVPEEAPNLPPGVALSDFLPEETVVPPLIPVLIPDHTELLIGQYRFSANLIATLEIWARALNDLVKTPSDELERMGRIESAQGVWLDYLARRLGVERPLTSVGASDPRWGFDDAGFGWDQVPFRGAADSAVVYPLPDSVFRGFLQARIVTLLSTGLIPELLRACQYIDPSINRNEVEDNRDMSVTITSGLAWAMRLARDGGFLPRVAGVTVTIEERTSG